MKTLTSLPSTTRLPRLANVLPGLVLSRLSGVEQGILQVEWDGKRHLFGTPAGDGLEASVRVHDAEFFTSLLLRGSIGAAESYVRGHWSADDLTNVVRLLVRNREVLEGVDGRWTWLAKPLFKLFHSRRDNDRTGSRKNIEAHYDLSNELFALFLDPTMTYSCGIYEQPESTLEEASIAKIDRLCRKLDLTPDDHLLEIGTGWGALAAHAAEHYGCRVTTTTISKEQHAWAQRVFEERGLTGRVELLMKDYRDLEGRYDKLVSVEMIEAVGHRHYGEFFSTCSRLLAEDGVMAMQAITIADQVFDEAARAVDFIQRYIFPGSCIPSITALSQAMATNGDLRPVAIDDITAHYVPTLAQWRENLRSRHEDARALGMTSEDLRLWEYYFSYCEGGFAERQIGDVQMLLAKPRWNPSPIR